MTEIELLFSLYQTILILLTILELVVGCYRFLSTHLYMLTDLVFLLCANSGYDSLLYFSYIRMWRSGGRGLSF